MHRGGANLARTVFSWFGEGNRNGETTGVKTMANTPIRNAQQKLKVYVIAGSEDVGKSSVIHHLTGLQRTRVVELADTSGNGIGIYAKIQSLQEGDGISPQDFIKEVTDKFKISKNFSVVMVALRTDTIYKADIYIDEFIKAGWDIEYVAELGIGPGNTGFLSLHSQNNKYNYKTFARATYINQLAAQVRNFFNLI